jgi:hypothetical protein
MCECAAMGIDLVGCCYMQLRASCQLTQSVLIDWKCLVFHIASCAPSSCCWHSHSCAIRLLQHQTTWLQLCRLVSMRSLVLLETHAFSWLRWILSHPLCPFDAMLCLSTGCVCCNRLMLVYRNMAAVLATTFQHHSVNTTYNCACPPPLGVHKWLQHCQGLPVHVVLQVSRCK